MTVHTVTKFKAVNMLLVNDDSRTPHATSTVKNNSKFKCYSIVVLIDAKNLLI